MAADSAFPVLAAARLKGPSLCKWSADLPNIFQFWSGGILNSTLHQVVMPQNDKEGSETATKERFSIAYFVQPDFDTTLHVMTKS